MSRKKKEIIKEEKKEIVKEIDVEPTKSKSKEKSTMVLAVIFFLLLILVAFLGIKLLSRGNTRKADIVIPIHKKENNFDFGIDSVALAKEEKRDYVFKITNHYNGKVNTEEMPYQIVIENHTKNKITLKRNNEGPDLITTQESTIINGTLPKDTEEEIYYYVHLSSFEDENTKDYIYIQILS